VINDKSTPPDKNAPNGTSLYILNFTESVRSSRNWSQTSTWLIKHSTIKSKSQYRLTDTYPFSKTAKYPSANFHTFFQIKPRYKIYPYMRNSSIAPKLICSQTPSTSNKHFQTKVLIKNQKHLQADQPKRYQWVSHVQIHPTSRLNLEKYAEISAKAFYNLWKWTSINQPVLRLQSDHGTSNQPYQYLQSVPGTSDWFGEVKNTKQYAVKCILI